MFESCRPDHPKSPIQHGFRLFDRFAGVWVVFMLEAEIDSRVMRSWFEAVGESIGIIGSHLPGFFRYFASLSAIGVVHDLPAPMPTPLWRQWAKRAGGARYWPFNHVFP